MTSASEYPFLFSYNKFPENTVGRQPLLTQQLSCKASDRLYVYALFEMSDKED